jgi:hypothetical protein
MEACKIAPGKRIEGDDDAGGSDFKSHLIKSQLQCCRNWWWGKRGRAVGSGQWAVGSGQCSVSVQWEQKVSTA